MKKLIISFALLSLIGLALRLEICPAQDRQHDPPDRSCRIPLSNMGNGKLTIHLRSSTDSGKTWVNEEIGPDESICWRAVKIQVKLSTEREDKSVKEFHYLLEAGNRYNIYWNKSDMAWDIAKVTPR
jgi:hypothetical protein